VTRLSLQPYLGSGLFGGSAAAGVELGTAKSGGTVRAGGSCGEAFGFNKRNSWAASPAQKLSR